MYGLKFERCGVLARDVGWRYTLGCDFYNEEDSLIPKPPALSKEFPLEAGASGLSGLWVM